MKLLRYTVYMIAFPVGTFYGSYYFLFNKQESGLAWSGILAVIATNIVIASYVLMAWNEDEADQKLEHKKQRKVD